MHYVRLHHLCSARISSRPPRCKCRLDASPGPRGCGSSASGRPFLSAAKWSENAYIRRPASGNLACLLQKQPSDEYQLLVFCLGKVSLEEHLLGHGNEVSLSQRPAKPPSSHPTNEKASTALQISFRIPIDTGQFHHKRGQRRRVCVLASTSFFDITIQRISTKDVPTRFSAIATK